MAVEHPGVHAHPWDSSAQPEAALGGSAIAAVARRPARTVQGRPALASKGRQRWGAPRGPRASVGIHGSARGELGQLGHAAPVTNAPMTADGGIAAEKVTGRRVLRMWGCWGTLPLGWRRAQAVEHGAAELDLEVGHGELTLARA